MYGYMFAFAVVMGSKVFVRHVCFMLAVAIIASASTSFAQEVRTAIPQSDPHWLSRTYWNPQNWIRQPEPINNDALMQPKETYTNPQLKMYGPISGDQFRDIQKLAEASAAAAAAARKPLVAIARPQANHQAQSRPQQQTFISNAYNTAVSYVNGVVEVAGNWFRATSERLQRFLRTSNSVMQRPRMMCATAGGRRYVRSGDVPKYCCKAAVNDILVETNALRRRIPGNAAIDALDPMRRMRNSRGEPLFREITAEVGGDSFKAPVGAVLIYSDETPGKAASKRYGHMEVRTATSGENQFCSDFCAHAGIDKYAGLFGPNDRPIRQLRAVFVRTAAEDI